MPHRLRLAAIAAAIGFAPATSQARDPTTLVAAIQNDVLTLDATRDISSIAFIVLKNVYDALTFIEPDGRVVPMICASWTHSPDLTAWTFDIRADARFQDGTPITAADVVFSYRKIFQDPTSPYRPYVSRITSIDTTAERQVQVKLSAPFAAFDRQVSGIHIVPQAAYEKLGAQAFGQHPIGSGPFRVVNWVKDDRIEMTAFDGYWAGAPKIRHLVFRPVPAEAPRAAGLASGELDVVPDLPPALVDRLAKLPDVQVVTSPSNRVTYLGYNVKNPPLDKLAVRQAIDIAIDRDAISQKLLRGLGKPMAAIAAPMTFGFDPTLKLTPFDPARARTLLKQAGYNGEAITLLYATNRDPFADQVAQAIAGYMKDVGLNVQLQGMEYGAMFPIWLGAKIPSMFFFGFGPSTFDAELPLANLYESGAQGYWNSPEIDRLVQAQRAEGDPTKRAALIGDIWRMSQQNLPYSALYEVVQAYGVAKGLNWKPRPDGALIFRDAAWETK